MKGLILKDLLLIKGNARYILIFLVIFGLIALEGNDVLYIIAWTEIFNYFEKCADACEHVADTVGSIVMKNS